MLEHLKLKNFQKHKVLRLPLGRVTTVVGESDRGKTSVLRALRWLATNRPQGTAYVRHGETTASVSLRVDGRQITRKRGRDNTYVLDGQTLKAFGAEVPPAVAQTLNLGPANWQAQHDAPFWFADGGGEVSRALNAVINLGAVDGVLGHLGAAVRREGAALEAATGAVERARAERLALKGAKLADAALRGVEGLAGALEGRRQNAARLRGLVTEGVVLRVRATNAAERADGALPGIRAGTLWAERVERAEGLRQLVVAGREYVRKVTRPIPAGLAKLERRAGDIKGRRAWVTAVRGLVTAAEGRRARAEECAWQEEELNKRFNQQIGSTCPLCNQPLSPSPAPTST